MRACLSTASTSILVNGSPTNEFRLTRGIRQGDPLSPFLFLIVAEGLNVAMEEAMISGIFKGVRIGDGQDVCNHVTISHLQFVDDTIFFGDWSEDNVVGLLSILKCFEMASGLKVNLKKSKLLGLGVEESVVRVWADLIGCGVDLLPFKYLGLPVGCVMNRYASWNSVLDKFNCRLSSWKSRMISFGGRLTLVKSVLGSLPLYFFSLFRAPEKSQIWSNAMCCDKTPLQGTTRKKNQWPDPNSRTTRQHKLGISRVVKPRIPRELALFDLLVCNLLI